MLKKKLNTNQISYLKLIIDLSDEIGISVQEAKKIVDTSITLIKPQTIDYKKLKEEILNYLVLNFFSLICKL
jgi:hypothetical protein